MTPHLFLWLVSVYLYVAAAGLCLEQISASICVTGQEQTNIDLRSREEYLSAESFALKTLSFNSQRAVLDERHFGHGRTLLAPSRQSSLSNDGKGMLQYLPTGYTIDGGDLTQFFREAHHNLAATGMKLAPGTYHVTPKVEDGHHIYFPCNDDRTKPFEIDLSGCFFYFVKHDFAGLFLENCTSVHLHGPFEQTYLPDQLDFTQGTVVGRHDEKTPRTYVVQSHQGYPDRAIMLKEDGFGGQIYMSTDVLKGSCARTATKPEPATALGHGRYEIAFYEDPPCADVGDFFVAKGNSGTNGVRLENCINSTVELATVYHAGGFGFYQLLGQNNTFRNITLRPFPRPLGNDGHLPLLSSGWDGVHIGSAHTGTMLFDSLLLNSGDDAIASMGRYYTVAEVHASKTMVIMAAVGDFQINAGDMLTFYAPDTRVLGTAAIVKLFSVDQPDSTRGKKTQLNMPEDYDDFSFMQVELSQWPDTMRDLAFDDVVSSPSNNGNGFAIVGNTIGNLAGRGALIKSSNGIISDNIFFNLMGWAIEMAPEYFWAEADFVHNVVLSNNVINSNESGIWIGIDHGGEAGIPQYTNNYNVDIVGNTIVNSIHTPLTITSAGQVYVANNTFLNVLCAGEDKPNFPWQTPGSIIALANVEDVTFSGNAVVTNSKCFKPTGNYKQPVSMVNATNIYGLAGNFGSVSRHKTP